MGTSSPNGTPLQEEALHQHATSLGEPAVRERLYDLPPSAKLVARTLQDHAPLTPSEIADRSLLPGRTVRDALERLEAAELVEGRRNLEDARTRIYVLTSPSA